jgi:O-acetyl-ADP-ribose deacetylase (regulator of RNase III)/DNA-binding transcriptional MerR regulator
MPDDTSSSEPEYFDISELVERANAEARRLNVGELTVRAVRFYIQRGLFTKGVTVNKLPEIQQRSLPHKGNQRFFTDDDVKALVGIKGQLDAGKTVADLGGRDVRESSRPMVDDDFSMRKLLFTELNAVSNTFSNEIVLSSADYSTAAPRVEKSWTVELREDLTLHGTGAAPSDDAIRELMRVVKFHFAPLAAVAKPADTGTLKIEIELSDIAAPFNGGIVNSSDAEVTTGGGASARIWEVCGHDELGRERQKLADAGFERMEPGNAVFTGAGRGVNIGFEGIIHAHGPRWRSPYDKDGHTVSVEGEDELLARTWRAVLKVADDHGIGQLVTPAISSGIFGFPSPHVFEVAFRTLLDTETDVQVVRFRTISRRAFDQMIDSLQRVRHTV